MTAKITILIYKGGKKSVEKSKVELYNYLRNSKGK